MCGIAGVLTPLGTLSGSMSEAIRCMTQTLSHRGPDSMGYWHDDEGVISLGHCRLAVEDLSDAGSQPMHSSAERYVLVYNGEIYNHHELRRELRNAGYVFDWRGTSDTETLSAAMEMWGIRDAILKCNGMFAFAVWDRHEKSLTLGRDRFGEKPLYYGWCGNSFVFSSELRAIECLPDGNLTIDPVSIELFLRYTYVPCPRSMYKGIKKLSPWMFGNCFAITFQQTCYS